MPLPSPRAGGTCLVTGASSGIGVEIARALAGREYGLTLVARREDRLRALADELVTGSDLRIEVIAADLSLEDERARLAETLERRGLAVDVLVNNAGITTLGPVAGARRGAELELVRTDVEAVVDLCTLFVPGMVARGSGAVLNVASTAAFQPLPGQAGYGAAKAFVLSYSHALRAELRRSRVTVTALCPGPVATELADVAGAADHPLTLPRALWLSPPDVARAGIEGLERDRAVVVPGFVNRMGAVAASLVPDAVVAGVLALLHPLLQRRN